MSSQSGANPGDLFAAALQADIERLQAQGWREEQQFGRPVWVHPQAGTWHTLDEAIAWLRDHEQGGKP